MRFARRGGGFGGGGRGGFGGGGRRFGGRSFGNRDSEPKPVKVGEEYDVEISEVGSKGDGIARVKNFVVFVNGATQGEKTRIKITDVRGRFAIGEKVSGESSEATAEATEATEESAAEGEADEGSDENPEQGEGQEENEEEK